MKAVIIQASARSHGNTYQLIEDIKKDFQADSIDLKNYCINAYDYENNNQNDDFLPLIRQILDSYDLIILATPVYWYTMSGLLKNFLDRISDCLTIEKDTGRKFRGKRLAVLSCSSDNAIKEGFYMPFIETANYLGMHYSGHVHGWVEKGEIPLKATQRLNEFIVALSLPA